MERLEALRDLKLKLQIFVVGSVIAMFSELFSVELTASVETTKEEGKEKASAKEATKEVRENLEIKVDAKEKPQLKYDVMPALDAESWLKKPITLTKQELDILRDPIKKMVELPPKPAINNENSGVPKPEVKETNEKGNKKPTQPPQKPNVDAPPLAPEQPAKSMVGMEQREWLETDGDVSEKMRLGSGGVKKPRRGATKGLHTNPKNFPKVDQFQVSSETNDNGKFSAEREPQRSSVNSAQPPSEFDNVKVTGGQSVEKGR